MPVYRYARVHDGSDGANRLMAQGWRPVRECVADQQILVLLERDESPATGSLEWLGGKLSGEDMQRLPLFAGLTTDELSEVAAVLEVQQVAKEETVFSKGDIDAAIYIVLEGDVRIALPDLPVEDVEVLDAAPWQIFGEASFFSGEPHAATATATADSRLLKFSRNRFDDLQQAGRPAATKIAVNAAALLGQRLGAADHWVWELQQEDQSLRVARSWNRFRRRMYELG